MGILLLKISFPLRISLVNAMRILSHLLSKSFTENCVSLCVNDSGTGTPQSCLNENIEALDRRCEICSNDVALVSLL